MQTDQAYPRIRKNLKFLSSDSYPFKKKSGNPQDPECLPAENMDLCVS